MSLFDPPALTDDLAAANEAAVAALVREGKMPAAVLDHLGHTKHNIYNPACEYCTRKSARTTDSAP